MSATEKPSTYYLAYGSGRLLSEPISPLTSNDTAILNKQVWICVDEVTHAEKPTDAEIKNRISGSVGRTQNYKQRTLAELAALISLGCTVLPGYCGGRRKKEMWQEQQLWFVDIDNDSAMQERGYEPLGHTYAVERCAELGLPLVMSYETFSSSDWTDPDPAHQRYRLVFAKDTPITSREEAERFGSLLLLAFPESDPSTTQANRMFHGTNKEVNIWLRPFKMMDDTSCPTT